MGNMYCVISNHCINMVRHSVAQPKNTVVRVDVVKVAFGSKFTQPILPPNQQVSVPFGHVQVSLKRLHFPKGDICSRRHYDRDAKCDILSG
jgi:hypothetical protein